MKTKKKTKEIIPIREDSMLPEFPPDQKPHTEINQNHESGTEIKPPSFPEIFPLKKEEEELDLESEPVAEE
jgi:hypothetical protein